MGGRAETQNHRQVAINARWPIQSNRFQGIKLQELTGVTLAGKAVLFLLCTKRIICTCSRVVMRGCTMPGLSRYYVIVFKTSVSANWTSHQTRNEPMSEFIRGLKMMSASVWTGSAVWRPQHAGAVQRNFPPSFPHCCLCYLTGFLQRGCQLLWGKTPMIIEQHCCLLLLLLARLEQRSASAPLLLQTSRFRVSTSLPSRPLWVVGVGKAYEKNRIWEDKLLRN